MIVLLFFIFFVLLVYFIFFVSQFYNIIFFNYPPFLSTKLESIAKIISLIKIKDGAVVYEIGCGRARFLRKIETIYPTTELIGVENLFSIYFINKFRLKLQGSKIKLLNKDLLKLNLQTADIIYCYLNNNIMIQLENKIIKECKKGTQIISQTFSLPNLKPDNTIFLNNKKIYFYII